MKLIKILAAYLAAITISYNTSAQKTDAPLKIETGLITGVKSQTSNVVSYKGIPFAAPPVKDLRWKAPQPAASWTGVRKCEAYGNDPYQNPPGAQGMWSAEFFIPPTSTRSEDCLYLNVWTAAKPKAKKPVLVWIYGGGFNSGGGDVPIYDGEATANKDIIFVSCNYRVGIFGSFAHPELSKESDYKASGNYGLLDQIAVLKWVQKNIAAFGGDPNNVTIAGQSAGSMSVNCLLASPLANGLFKKAILESGAYLASATRNMNTLQQAEDAGVRTVEDLKTNSVAELRNLSAEYVQNTIRGAFGPIIDGYVLPASIPTIFAANKENKAMLLTGWNENESYNASPSTAADYKKRYENTYGTNAVIFFKYFPGNNNMEAAASQNKLSTSLQFGIQNYALANIQSQKGVVVYAYRFTHRVPGNDQYAKYGAFHSGELAYVYDNLKFLNRPWQPLDHELAKTLSTYWANFIKTGNPNSKGLPEWPNYTVTANRTMILGDKLEVRTMPDKAALDFLLTNTR
jgi:para-nitrobenzyl esterase